MPVEQIAGQYQASPQTFSDGTIAVQVDAQGNLKTVGGGTPGTPGSGATSVQGFAYTSTVNLTRTSDTNAYAAGDVVGSATGSTAALTFASVGPSGGGDVFLTASLYSINIAAVPSGMTSFQLALYSVTPPSAYGDNTLWDLPSGDRASFLGFMPLGTPVDMGATLFVETFGVNKQITVPSGGSLFAYLITAGAYTPSSADVFKIVLKATGV